MRDGPLWLVNHTSSNAHISFSTQFTCIFFYWLKWPWESRGRVSWRERSYRHLKDSYTTEVPPVPGQSMGGPRIRHHSQTLGPVHGRHKQMLQTHPAHCLPGLLPAGGRLVTMVWPNSWEHLPDPSPSCLRLSSRPGDCSRKTITASSPVGCPAITHTTAISSVQQGNWISTQLSRRSIIMTCYWRPHVRGPPIIICHTWEAPICSSVLF